MDTDLIKGGGGGLAADLMESLRISGEDKEERHESEQSDGDRNSCTMV